jgi:hypothetical protein
VSKSSEIREAREAQRLTYEEFRVTFGWGQDHGPSPIAGKVAHYTTIWAPKLSLASDMAMTRYSGNWAHLYPKDHWTRWGAEMQKIEELEVLQYVEDEIIPAYSSESAERSGKTIIYGRGETREYKPIPRL